MMSQQWSSWPVLAFLLLLFTAGCRVDGYGVELEAGMSPEVIVLQTQYGDIHIGLFAQDAPQTVKHVLELVELGCYNTVPITWLSHSVGAKVMPVLEKRVVPLSRTQRAVAEKTVPLELNNLSHERGYVSMVRGSDLDSATSSFTVLLKGAPSLDGKFTVFGKVLRGMDILDRRVKGVRHNRTLPIHSSHFYEADTVKHMSCSDRNVDFYLSDKWNGPVPLSEDCLRKHVNMPMPYERSTTVLMKGLPKMGTTWTEVFVGRLMDEVCKSSVYHCRSQVVSRGAISVFVKDQEESIGTALQWKCNSKHDFPMSKAVGAPEDAKVGAFYNFDNGVLAPWEECLQNKTYLAYEECLPAWHAAPDYELFMDSRAHAAMKEFGGEEWRIVDEEAQNKKYILVMRDPRDATVSLMHYHHDGADDEKLQEGTKQYIKHYTIWLGFWYWYQTRYVSALYPTMVLMYRDVKEDPVREYGRVLDYLGLKASVDLIQRVVDETDFENMRKMEYQRKLPGRNRAKGDNRKVRSGQAQGFYNELSPETIKYCNQVMRDLLPPELLAHFDVQ